ncbi:hypothetical protein Pcinc_033347 [Petrolisthes cinctipes]|uniref:Uncharacterized protein n=1 Tax=Petrolisthes cinctipes TaxID=88211 RepID=A0AAE1ESK9_PETCI|nr:hypothetical protein Pcinc_033347 [Petrolisthes cinctipes]
MGANMAIHAFTPVDLTRNLKGVNTRVGEEDGVLCDLQPPTPLQAGETNKRIMIMAFYRAFLPPVRQPRPSHPRMRSGVSECQVGVWGMARSPGRDLTSATPTWSEL